MCGKMILEWRKWLLMCLVAQTADAFSECTYSGYKRGIMPMPSSLKFRGQLWNRTSRSLSATLEASTMSSESDFADGRPKKKVLQKKRKNSNPARDTAFLRKRTAYLLDVTADGHHHAELHDSDNSEGTVLKANGATAEHANGVPRSRGMKVETKSFHFLIDAWAFSGELDAADQALALLDRMESLQDSDEFKVALDVRSYTKVINAVSRSRLPRAGEIAESILEKMDNLYASGANTDAKPNTHTYTAVIEAYANSGTESAAGKAEAMLEKLIERYESGDPDVRPTARCFNAVIKALAKSGNPDAAKRAEDIFNRMETLYNAGADEAKPNSFNYLSLITAWANCGDEGSAERAEQILERMEHQFRSGNDQCQPTTVSYNAVIAAYAKGGEEGAAMHAEELLHRMEQRYEAGDENVKPNSRSFNTVINAWAKSQHVDSASRASELLVEMTSLSEDGNEAVRPDVHSFCSVINAWARSQHPDKAERANNLFREMSKLYEEGNINLRPNVVAVNAVMNACAYTGGDVHDQSRAMDIAHKRLSELEKSSYGKPDQVTYGTFLKVCANQMSDCDNRQQVIEIIFKKCCRDGQVGNLVIQQLKTMGPPELYERLVGRHVEEDVNMSELPHEWTCNVVEGKWRRRRNLGES